MQPIAPIHEVVDDYHGTKIRDAYRYMENPQDPEVQVWMKAQADHTSEVLTSISGRKELLGRIQKIEDSVAARVFNVQRLPNGKYFYLKRLPVENCEKLYVREGLDGPETLLVDPEALERATGKPHALNYFVASPGGEHVAYGISPMGSEDAILNVLVVASGKTVDAPIDRARFAEPSWLPDGRGFFYNRLQLLPPDAPSTERFQRSRVYLHRLGTNPESDEFVFGEGLVGVDIQPAEFPSIRVPSGSDHAIGYINSGVSPESSLYDAPLSKIDGTGTPWRKLFTLADQVSKVELRDDDLYVLTFKDAPRFKVVKTSLAAPDLSTAATVVPMSEAVVQDIGASKDALYAQLMDVTVGQLVRVPYQRTEGPERLPLPIEGTIHLMGINAELSGALFVLTSWTRAPGIYQYEPATRGVSDTRLQPLGAFDAPGDLVSTEVKVRSHDGTTVPLSIIHKRGLTMDGRNPTFLNGYGAYGFALNPHFLPRQLAWFERGGIIAQAHVRGGGEYGEEWHRAGFQKTKPNTWKDFIACAEYLCAEGYTSPGFLAGTGVSAGGIMIGRAITERPDLFAAALPAVGVLDTLRAETTANGVPNIPEFGTTATEEGFKALYEMSAYHHVEDGVKYPAIMLTHGFHDPRVEVWTSAKMAARLQAATSSGKPVLLRIDYESGHGIGTTKKQRQAEWADIFSFILWRCGAPEFQP